MTELFAAGGILYVIIVIILAIVTPYPPPTKISTPEERAGMKESVAVLAAVISVMLFTGCGGQTKDSAKAIPISLGSLKDWQSGVGERNRTPPKQTPDGIRLESRGYGNCEITRSLPASAVNENTFLDLTITPEYSSSDSYAQFQVTIEALDYGGSVVGLVHVGYGSPTSDFDSNHGFGGVRGNSLQIPILGSYDGEQKRVQRHLWADFKSIPGFDSSRAKEYRIRLMQRSGLNGQTTRLVVNRLLIGSP